MNRLQELNNRLSAFLQTENVVTAPEELESRLLAWAKECFQIRKLTIPASEDNWRQSAIHLIASHKISVFSLICTHIEKEHRLPAIKKGAEQLAHMLSTPSRFQTNPQHFIREREAGEQVTTAQWIKLRPLDSNDGWMYSTGSAVVLAEIYNIYAVRLIDDQHRAFFQWCIGNSEHLDINAICMLFSDAPKIVNNESGRLYRTLSPPSLWLEVLRVFYPLLTLMELTEQDKIYIRNTQPDVFRAITDATALLFRREDRIIVIIQNYCFFSF